MKATTKHHFHKGMANLHPFQTLYILPQNGKFYIWHDNTTIGPAFATIKELKAWAMDNLYNEYV